MRWRRRQASPSSSKVGAVPKDFAPALRTPTPLWTHYDAKFYRLKLPDEVPLVHQERAYTSPIWYTLKE